ncbi:MAG: response regulator [Leptospirales bacterium]|nr:response regulator [Leptospirales bacterium]
MHALILDDDPDSVALLRKAVTEAGFQAADCSRAADAINLFDQYKPQLLLLDIGLPGQDGFFALRRLRARHQALNDGVHRVFLMVSARSDYNAAEDAANFGADGFVNKPFNIQELQGKIRMLFGRKD